MLSLMKKLLAIIVLSLCFIIPSQADDIRDFQIEGMSIGDSLLNFVSKKSIKTQIKDRTTSVYYEKDYEGGHPENNYSEKLVLMDSNVSKLARMERPPSKNLDGPPMWL